MSTRAAVVPEGARTGRVAATAAVGVRPYAVLTKPGITAYVALTAVAAAVAAAPANPATLLAVLVATLLMSSGAAAANHVLERGPDAAMLRTARRPVASGVMTAGTATAFAVALTGLGLAVSTAALPAVTTAILVLCHITYVAAYTPLKRLSRSCTAVGAVPGALPVLAGWTAAGAAIDATALCLTGVLLLWQMPHFLAIGWVHRHDYAAAGFRMLMVGDETGRTTALASAACALAIIPLSMLPVVAGGLGTVYLAAAAGLGTAYAAVACHFLAEPAIRRARALFVASLAFLPLFLAAVMADRTLAR
ncbi:MAG TPA: protoheme IX farnesyltransferase [Longimicrobiales bacterium]|nr:protoheme IX farnesyltransferase [Longimicrobiales bacterium]